MSLDVNNYIPALKYGGTINPLNDIELTSAYILVGNSSNVAVGVAVSGDVALSNAGVATVTDLTIASEARGDLLRRGASTWERFSAKDSGKIVLGDGTDVISATMSGDATISAAGAVTVTGATAAFNIGTNVTLAKEVNHTVTVTTTTTAATAGGNLTLTAGAGATTGAGGNIALVGGASGAGATGNGGTASVTGGAAASTDGNGGDVVITAGALSGTGKAGRILHRSMFSILQGAQTAKTTSATLTAAEVLAGIITVNQGAAGTSAQQLPLATDLDTALPTFAAGDSFDFSVINISTVDAEDASVTTNTGWTLVGNMDIHAYSAAGSLNSSGRFRARKTGTGTWTLYRIS